MSNDFTNTEGWSGEQIREKLEQVKRSIGWEATHGSARRWWIVLEAESDEPGLGIVLRLAEELAARRATISDLFLTYLRSPDSDPFKSLGRLGDADRLPGGDSPAAAQPDGPLEQRVRTIIVDVLGVAPEEVTPEADFMVDLGADSMDIVELVIAFEGEFGMEVTDEKLSGVSTVGDAIDRLRRLT